MIKSNNSQSNRKNSLQSNYLYFHGRNDGLGNRIEEILNFSAYCNLHNLQGRYFWNNWKSKKNRKYDIPILCSNIKITQSIYHLCKSKCLSQEIDFSNLTFEHIQNATKLIVPIRPVAFNSTGDVIGLHIRRGDRIVNSKNTIHKDFMTVDQSNACIRQTIDLINRKVNCKYLFITSDDKKIISYVTERLKPSIEVVSPISQFKSAELIDFFALTLCKEIYMCSKFSSFAITAAILNNSLLHTYFRPEESNLNRFKVRFNYLPLIKS